MPFWSCAMRSKIGYIKKEAAEILRLKPSQIQFYTDRGLIRPDIHAPIGRGTRRVYSKRNLLEILLVKRLVENGFSIEEAAGAIHSFRAISKLSAPAFKLTEEFWKVDDIDPTISIFFTHHLYYIDRDKNRRNGAFGIVSLEEMEKNKDKLTADTISYQVINVTDLVGHLRGA
jgi:DNA-binding transcriptional MerR regulator